MRLSKRAGENSMNLEVSKNYINMHICYIQCGYIYIYIYI